jgi:hypothetical protein
MLQRASIEFLDRNWVTRLYGFLGHLTYGFIIAMLCLSGASYAKDCTNPRPPRAVILPIPFADGVIRGAVTEKMLMSMSHRKLALPPGNNSEFMLLNSSLIQTETISDYRAALAKGAIIQGSYAIGMARFFVHASGVEEFLRHSSDSKISHFDEDWMARLSVSLIIWSGTEEKATHEMDTTAGKTLHDSRVSG